MQDRDAGCGTAYPLQRQLDPEDPEGLGGGRGAGGVKSHLSLRNVLKALQEEAREPNSARRGRRRGRQPQSFLSRPLPSGMGNIRAPSRRVRYRVMPDKETSAGCGDAGAGISHRGFWEIVYSVMNKQCNPGGLCLEVIRRAQCQHPKFI